MIRIWCQCGRQLKAKETMIGQPVQCPLCRRLTIVPESDMPRSADFPPVPPRGGVNQFGEITRRGADGESITRPPEAGGKLGGEERPAKKSRLPVIVGATAVCVAVGLLVPVYSAYNSGRERQRETSNLLQLGLALGHFESIHGALPQAAAYRTRDGKPGLSWRVAILPYIEQDALFRQFKLDEPWDSPSNLPLLPLMPKVYLQPWQTDDGSGLTHSQVFVGLGAAFEERNWRSPRSRAGQALPNPPLLGWRFPDFTDGASNTILVAPAARPVPWTKPEDLVYEPHRPLPLLNYRSWGASVVTANGSVNYLPRDTPEATLRALITRNGGEQITWP